MISALSLAEKAQAYLQRLCVEIPSRRVGSAGNREATELFDIDSAQSDTLGFPVNHSWQESERIVHTT